jgi:hypothetical protein
MKFLAVLPLLFTLACANFPGETPRQKTAAAVNLAAGSPFYLLSGLSGVFLNLLAYPTAWIWGEPEKDEDVVIWFSADYGPNYASMNTPPCWTYVGTEPENRKLAETIFAGQHFRQVRLQSLEYEWPPTFVVCRTEVGMTKNKRGDESFPLDPIDNPYLRR